jgi:hypothetical protein
LIIDNVTCERLISFVDCHLNATIHINSGTFNGLSISGGLITKPLIVYGGTFNRSFELSEIDALDMEKDFFVSIGLLGGNFNCDVKIYKGAFHRISIGAGMLKSVGIRIGPHSFHNDNLEPYIRELIVAPKEIEVLDVDGFTIEHLIVTGVLGKGIYSIGNATLNNLEFTSFLNLGRARFDNITNCGTKKTNSSLIMTHCDLGKTRFSGIDFTRYPRINISDCTLTEIESSNTKWFSPDQLDNLNEETKRDLFRQLKHAMIRQGNRIDELQFQAAEMNAYHKTLSVRRDFWDFLVLSIGKYTNNFGTNYILPAKWIVVFSFLIFLLWAQGLSFWDRWDSVFVVANRAHPIDYLVSKDMLTNAFVAVDFVGRILVGVLIYQLIVPFRKFARG